MCLAEIKDEYGAEWKDSLEEKGCEWPEPVVWGVGSYPRPSPVNCNCRLGKLESYNDNSLVGATPSEGQREWS